MAKEDKDVNNEEVVTVNNEEIIANTSGNRKLGEFEIGMDKVIYIKRKSIALSYGMNGNANLKAENLGGKLGKSYYRFDYRGEIFTEDTDSDFSIAHANGNIARVVFDRTEDGLSLVTFVSKDEEESAELAQHNREMRSIDRKLAMMKLEFTQKAMNSGQFSFNPKEVNDLIGL